LVFCFAVRLLYSFQEIVVDIISLKRIVQLRENQFLFDTLTVWRIRQMAKQQARFWIFTVSPVRIKINKGQTLSHYRGWRHEEGWSSESHTFSFDGEVVTSEYGTDGRDCDGRLSTSGESHCAVADLQSGYFDESEGIHYPDWQRGKQSQRDEYAEAAGY
jgi:hypothetical protein